MFFVAKRKKWLRHYIMAQPSLFVPYFDFTYEYGDKAKVVISWKSV